MRVFFHKKATRAGGFTLIELLVVMAILGVLAAAVLPLGEALLIAQKERALRQALNDIRMAIDDYKRAVDSGAIAKTTDSGYPPNLEVLREGAIDQRPAAYGQHLYFLRSLPRDPFADMQLPAAATWRLRSYASSPDKPLPGADVFDIHSSSNGLALDASPYAQW